MTPTSSSEPLAIPFAESPYMEAELEALSPEDQGLVRHFAERGYVVVDFEHKNLASLSSTVIANLAERYPEEDRRVENAWYFQPEVRELATAPAMMRTLQLLYGRVPIPFQTLNFDSGTEQAAHSDTVHFHCIPRHFMAGVWLALEDADEENGALFVYPGSHKLPEYDMTSLGLTPSWKDYGQYERRLAEILACSGLERKVLSLKKGQAIIWAANLVHGGIPIADTSRTRHSQVTHYYFEEGVYYFPMGSEPIAGKVILREVINLVSGEFVAPRLTGHGLSLSQFPNVWTYPRPLPDWIKTPLNFDRTRAAAGRSALADHNHALLRSLTNSEVRLQQAESIVAEFVANSKLQPSRRFAEPDTLDLASLRLAWRVSKTLSAMRKKFLRALGFRRGDEGLPNRRVEPGAPDPRKP